MTADAAVTLPPMLATITPGTVLLAVVIVVGLWLALALIAFAIRPMVEAKAARIAYEGGLGDGYTRDELNVAVWHAVARTSAFVEGDFPLDVSERIAASVLDDLDLNRLPLPDFDGTLRPEDLLTEQGLEAMRQAEREVDDHVIYGDPLRRLRDRYEGDDAR